MFYCSRIEVSAVIDVKEIRASKKSIICHYCFLDEGFMFQLSLCNGCNNVSKKSMNLKDVAILNS